MQKYTRIVRVECYAGYRGEEEPRRLVRGGECLQVVEILDRWLAPSHRYFKVRCSDASILMLRHDPTSGDWEVHGKGHGHAAGL
jgi:hypothetical protein